MEERMKKLSFSLVLVLSLLIISVTSVFAAGPTGNWVSGITCQNLDDVSAATITISFYNEDGSLALSYNDSISAGGSLKYFTPSSPVGLPAPFIGSAIVSSNTLVACNVNTQTTGVGTISSPYRIGTNAGLIESDTASIMYAPQVMKNLASTWNSYIAIQNTSSSSVDIEIAYKDTAGTSINAALEEITIPAYSTYISYQNENTNLADGFVGSAVVTATNPNTTKLAMIVNFYNEGSSSSTSQFHSYNGFNGGADVLYIPRVVRQFYGYNGGLTVQNVGTIATIVDIEFYFAGNTYNYATSSINPGASVVLYLPNLPELNALDSMNMANRVGSAKATVRTSGAEIVAIINEDNRGNSADNNGSPVPVERIGQGSTYNAIADGLQSNALFFAQLTNKAGGVFSGGIQIANTSSSIASCNFSFVGDSDAAFTANIPANGSVSYYGPNILNLDVGFNAGVSVICDQNVVGIGNLAVEPGSGKYGDSFTQSNGLNQTIAP